MISVAICEDEQHTATELAGQTESFFAKQGLPSHISCFTSGEQLLLRGSDYDIVLMDIRLSGMSGMETARMLRRRGRKCAIIFITAIREDVFRAFDVDAVHFLVKPVGERTLHAALEKAERRMRRQGGQWLTISRGQSVRKLPLDDIIYCEAVDHRISFCLRDGEKALYYHRMADLLEELDGRFYRCHRSYVVNLAYVSALQGGEVYMSNGDVALVSRRSRRELSERLLAFLRGEILE